MATREKIEGFVMAKSNSSFMYISKRVTSSDLLNFRAVVGHELIHAYHYYTIGVINRVMTETIAYQYTANVRFQGGDFAGGMKDLNTMMKKGYVVKVDPKYIIPKVLTIY